MYALGLAALGLWAYISDKSLSLVPMLQLLHVEYNDIEEAISDVWDGMEASSDVRDANKGGQ